MNFNVHLDDWSAPNHHQLLLTMNFQVPDGPEGKELMAELGISVLPTIQYYKHGKMLWEQAGSVGMEQELGEGELSSTGGNFCPDVSGLTGDV
eukprot:1150093-Pelagomonas_calceolata.AAC.4